MLGEKKTRKKKTCLITNSLRSPIVLSNDYIQRHSLSVKRLLSVMKLADCTIFLLGAGAKAFLFFFFFPPHGVTAAKQPSLSHSDANEMQMQLKRSAG